MDTEVLKQETKVYKGHLSKYDILDEQNKDNGFKIYPFISKCLKAASYDLTPTIVAMSSRTGMLETVYREENYKKDAYYIYVHPKDTVLIVSNEFIVLPPNIAGYISSRVSKVVEGFGHISTTIDPNWSGSVLIAVSNPSNQLLKIYVGMSQENLGGIGENITNNYPNQLATMTFHYLNTPCSKEEIENKHKVMRKDLLENISYRQKKGFRALLRKIFYRKRRGFTDYFFVSCEEMEVNFSNEKWDAFLKDFSSLTFESTEKNKKMSKKAQMNASSYIITENFLIRFYHFLIKYRQLIKLFFFFFIILFLWVYMPSEEFKNFIIERIKNIL